MSTSGESLSAGRWRSVRRFRLSALLFWLIAVYGALLVQHFLPGSKEISILLGLGVMLLALLVTNLAFRFAVSRMAPLLPRPVEIKPTPTFTGAATAVYARPPQIHYPPLALARGQCGWVALKLRVDPTGRVRSYAVIDQSPGRTFERAVALSLAGARVELADNSANPTIVTSVIRFALSAAHAPEGPPAKATAR